MKRISASAFLSVLLLAVIATCAQAAAPRAAVFPGIAVADQTAHSVAATRPAGVYSIAAAFTDPAAAVLAIGTRLVDLQSDVTEDNAGNGDPDSPPDGNDGGWDWSVSVGQLHHVNNGSYENLYGPIARGLVQAAVVTGNARLGVGAGDVFAGISRAGTGLLGTSYYRIWDADLASAYIGWAAKTGNAALKDTIKARHDQELSVRGGAGGRARTIRNGRRSQGIVGLWPWDIHLLANDSKALAGAFPGSAAAYEAEADSIAKVLVDDRNGLLGPGGWDPALTQDYHLSGLTGALRIFDGSQWTGDNTLAVTMRDSLVNAQLSSGSWGEWWGGVFYSDNAQVTAYAVLALTEYAKRHNDAWAMQAAFRGRQWLLTIVSSGGIVDDGGGEYTESDAEVCQALLTGDDVTPVPPATCITPADSCVQVPVVFNRVDTTPVRGFSVTLTLSSNLALCGGGIVQGGYLSGVGGTNYQVLSLGGKSYTVDCAILGLPCGATGNGTLFTLNLASSAPSGTGTVTINSVTVRDCVNAPVSAAPGAPAVITIDNTAPVAIADLAAAQVKTGNDADGTTKVTLTFTAAGDATAVAVYRAGYGNYPEYDDAPGSGSVPATPGAYPPGAPWALTGVTASGQRDEVSTRDFWYYVAYVEDACGNWSAVSNKTGGTLNYHLGDVSDGYTDCVGNNLVATEDVSLLGTHYGATLGVSDVYGCLDVGPTTDWYVNARPTTDNKVNFEDLMMFAINYGQVSAPTGPPLVNEPVLAEPVVVAVEGPAAVTAGESFVVVLRLGGAGGLQGLSAQLSWDATVAKPVQVEAGDLMARQNGVVFSAGAGNVDAAVLGTGREIVGEGVLATVRFEALASGNPQVALAAVHGRDTQNRRVELTGATPAVPAATYLAAATPNPFTGATSLSFALAQGGAAELGIYSVDGRRVRTLASGTREAGTYRLSWDGRDDGGRGVGPGVYFARLETVDGRFHRTVVVMQ